MTHQIHFDKKFYLDKKTGYWISTTCPKIRAHVWVWKYHHGDVEKGYHIHHKDEDKSNNSIENLEKISCSLHLSLHMSQEENRKRSSKQAEKVRHLTKEWHSSDEGKEWHRNHGLKTWEERNVILIICIECCQSVETKTYHQTFCSNACKSKWRRRIGIDEIDKICPICNRNYSSNKYSRSKTCGRKCGKLLKNKIG